MAIVHIKYLDEFSEWINKLDYRDKQWHAQFFPGKTVIANSLVTIIEALMLHVMHETIALCCDALNVTSAELEQKNRNQAMSDIRMATANILLDRFDHKISWSLMAKPMGWKGHSMFWHARANADVVQISDLISRVYSRYPFLKNNYNGLR